MLLLRRRRSRRARLEPPRKRRQMKSFGIEGTWTLLLTNKQVHGGPYLFYKNSTQAIKDQTNSNHRSNFLRAGCRDHQ